MDKSEIRHRLGRFLDGEMPEEERREIEKSIKENPDWQAEYNKLLSIRDMADRLELEADASFWEKNRDEILDKIKNREKPETEIIEIKKSSRRGMVIKLLAVAASIALIAFVSIYEFEKISPEKKLATTPQIRTPNSSVDVPKTISSEERKQLEQTAEPELIDSSYIMGEETGTIHRVVDQTDKDAVSINLPGGPEFHKTDRNEISVQEYDKKEKLIPVGNEVADEALKSRTKQLPEYKPKAAVEEPSPELTYSAPPPVAESVQPKAGIETRTQAIERLSVEDLADSKEIQIQELSRQKLDSLDNEYYDLVSKHYQELAVKGRTAKGDEEMQLRINTIASAYFLNGNMAKDSSTVQKMIARLENLADLSPDSTMRDSLIELADSLRRLNR